MANSTHNPIVPHPVVRISDPSPSSSSSSSSTLSISSHGDDIDNHRQRIEQCDVILNGFSSDTPAEAKALAVLKAFREHLPEDGLDNFVDDILSCARLGGMPYIQQLGHHLRTAILIPFRILSVGQPSLQHTHNPLSLKPEHINEIKHLGEICLARDGRRCVYTGNIDVRHVQDEPDTDPVAPTAPRYILPYWLKDDTEQTPQQADAKRTIWWSIHRYFPSLAGKIDGSSINQPGNVLTLNESVFSDFGECQLAFKPLATENEYDVVVLGPVSSGYPFNTGYSMTKMVLSAHDALELPSRDFLDMHYRVAKMLSVNGY